jgi:hypothetical protein
MDQDWECRRLFQVPYETNLVDFGLIVGVGAIARGHPERDYYPTLISHTSFSEFSYNSTTHSILLKLKMATELLSSSLVRESGDRWRTLKRARVHKLEPMENRGLRSMQNLVSLGLPHRGSVKPNRAGQRGKGRPIRGDS